jgi:phosphoribosyl 1,2-cyclic phosphodiesterase
VCTPDDHRIAVATDMGCVTEDVLEAALGCEAVFLETNYDPALLESGSYPYYLKRRIRSDLGHLANGSAADFAARLLQNGARRFILSHLSRENNRPDLASAAVAQRLDGLGAKPGEDYELDVSPRETIGRLVRL